MANEEMNTEEKKKESDIDHKLYLLIRAYNELSEKVDRLQCELDSVRAEGAEHHENIVSSDEKTDGEIKKKAGSEGKKSDVKKVGKKHAGKTIGTIVFYRLLVLMILGAVLVRSSSDGSPKSLAGFSGMIVLSGSMQSEIPKGSLVINRSVEPDTLQVGDDITYLANSTTTVTHRIIDIVGSYEDTGQPAFQTQGIENPEPDEALVPAGNVVGKVIWHSEILGNIAETITDNFPVIIFFIVVIVILVNVLWRINRKVDDEEGRS